MGYIAIVMIKMMVFFFFFFGSDDWETSRDWLMRMIRMMVDGGSLMRIIVMIA